jgi:hypothetical protein
MKVVTPAGERYEAPDIKALQEALEKADKEWSADPSSDEKYGAWQNAVRALAEVVVPEMEKPTNPWQDLQALIQDAMDREDREAFDEHYDRQLLPCEVDTVDPDPWVEDTQAVAADLQADARAQYEEGQR